MTLNSPSSKSWKVDMKYFENGGRYDDGFNVSLIGNRPCAIDWNYDLWPCLTSHRLRFKSQECHFKYLENGERWCYTQRTSDYSKPIMGFRLALRKLWQIRWWGQWKSSRKPPMRYWLAPWSLAKVDLDHPRFRWQECHFKYLEMIWDMMLYSKDIHGLSIDTRNFDRGWPLTITVQGH